MVKKKTNNDKGKEVKENEGKLDIDSESSPHERENDKKKQKMIVYVQQKVKRRIHIMLTQMKQYELINFPRKRVDQSKTVHILIKTQHKKAVSLAAQKIMS
ncbi:Vps3p [Saccharomyces cerevisiae CEN.PK113-7D]|uniref:Vps3p n=1 Tax=Saccharomyces cerevisiae (strain CEN.PK113-7D) TaxID=889517 RepID=N1PAL3_YEASC|nr:Vps3p [Saccharomyces cerevisiae CEN.PK113-7D]